MVMVTVGYDCSPKRSEIVHRLAPAGWPSIESLPLRRMEKAEESQQDDRCMRHTSDIRGLLFVSGDSTNFENPLLK